MITLTHLIVTIVSLILAGIFNAEQDTIREFIENNNSKRRPGYLKIFEKYFISNSWWVTIRPYNWFTRYIAYSRDGWHFNKGISLSFLFVAPTIIICLYFGLTEWYYYLLINQIPIPFIRGSVFELFYEN